MAVFSIGLPFLLMGLLLALYTVRRTHGRGFWLALVGMGGLPAIYLCIRYFMEDRSNTFYPGNWWAGVLVYVALALVGVAWGLIEAHRDHRAAGLKENR
jgi:hypothetical protein